MAMKNKTMTINLGLALNRQRMLRNPSYRMKVEIQKRERRKCQIYNRFQEIKRLRVNIMNISKMRWSDTGIFINMQPSDGYRHGVVIAFDNYIKPSVTQFLSL